LVDLALWVADYYGSTPACAGARRAYNANVGETERSAALGALVAEAPPSISPIRRTSAGRIASLLDGDGRQRPVYGATGHGKTEV